MIPRVRSFSCQSVVVSDLVIKGDPSADAGTGFRTGLKRVQVHAFVFHRAPEAFDKHFVQPVATPVHGDADAFSHRTFVKAKLVNWLPWSVLKISGLPYFAKASSRALMQKSTSMVLESRRDSTSRPCQSITATKYRKPLRIGIYVMSAHQT